MPLLQMIQNILMVQYRESQENQGSHNHKSSELVQSLWMTVDELDSYMYQTVGHNAIDLYAQAMDLPLYQGIIQGSSVDQGKVYKENEQDEVEDLYKLLKNIRVLSVAKFHYPWTRDYSNTHAVVFTVKLYMYLSKSVSSNIVSYHSNMIWSWASENCFGWPDHFF